MVDDPIFIIIMATFSGKSKNKILFICNEINAKKICSLNETKGTSRYRTPWMLVYTKDIKQYCGMDNWEQLLDKPDKFFNKDDLRFERLFYENDITYIYSYR